MASRRHDRRPPERDKTRINERIRVKEVRLVDENGDQLGIKPTAKALAYAQERELDLVEIAPQAKPPVCKVLNYSKYKYELEQKAKAAKKHQKKTHVHEIKLRPKIADHDFETKRNHVERFLKKGDKVKVTIMFRGRENEHAELGRALLDRLVASFNGYALVEQKPLKEGRDMHMLIAPNPEHSAEHPEATEAA